MYDLSGCMNVCVLCAWLVPVGAEGEDSLEEHLQTVVSQHMGTANQAQTLCRNSYYTFYMLLALITGTLLNTFMSMFSKYWPVTFFSCMIMGLN
jgi:hypothetical protein